MKKYKELENLQKLKENGSLTEEEYKKEKEKILNNNNKIKILIIILIIILIACIGIGAYYFIHKNTPLENKEENTDEEIKQASANIQENGVQKISFNNMSGDDANLDEIQKDIVNYFDNNYFEFYAKSAQIYPQIFQDAKVTTPASVLKVLESDNEEFEVLAVQFWEYNYYQNSNIEEVPVEQLLVISGKQLNARLITGDEIMLYGRYRGVENREIDGTSYMVSKIEASNIVRFDLQGYIQKHNYTTIKNVAEYIFRKDVKISEDNDEYSRPCYKVTLDNQSNANFKVFNMYKDYGDIRYNRQANDLGENIIKKLFVSADFQHYIVSTYDKNTRHVYIDYFNRDLQKIWSREFDYNSTKAYVSPMDYTATQMALVIDNDLYLVNLETGENIIEPVMVGEKIKINMMADGIILIGDNNKDAIMKVAYDGKILFRQNANTELEYIDTAYTQIVNNKMVIYLIGSEMMEEYLVINNEGKIELSTANN